MSEDSAPGPWWQRLLWLVAIWAISVASVGVVAYTLRFWLTGRI